MLALAVVHSVRATEVSVRGCQYATATSWIAGSLLTGEVKERESLGSSAKHVIFIGYFLKSYRHIAYFKPIFAVPSSPSKFNFNVTSSYPKATSCNMAKKSIL